MWSKKRGRGRSCQLDLVLLLFACCRLAQAECLWAAHALQVCLIEQAPGSQLLLLCVHSCLLHGVQRSTEHLGHVGAEGDEKYVTG